MNYKMQKRIRGSVSIFLVIIMVPMICVSGLIVDGSRAELAKASVSSAGDLTMNAALANYDTVLKDVYGLFAMSQTADDLSANLYNYFADTLMANGIIESKEEIDSNPLLQDVASAFSGNSSNLLKMEISEDDFSASPLADSSLANPYILKNQIVEYEKYRAPISSALSLLDGIASLKKILQQSEVNKAKTAVDEKAGELNESSNDLYEALKKYVDKSKTFNPLFDTFNYNGGYFSYRKAFENTIIPAYVRELAESMPYGIGMKKNNDGTYSFSFAIQYLEYTVGKDGTKWTSYTGKTTEKLREELEFALEAFDNGTVTEAETELITAPAIRDMSLSEKRSYATCFTIYMQKVYNLKNFYDAYNGQYNPGSDGTSFISTHESEITNIFENAVKFTKSLNTYKSEVDNARNYADDMVTALNSDIIQKIGWFAEIDTILQKAIDKLTDVETKITELNSANGTLKTKINNYNGSDDSDAFSKQMEQDYQYYKDNIDPAKITALKNKLTDLKTYFKDVKDYLKSVKFCDYAASDDGCNTLSNLVTKTKNKTNSSGVTNIEYIESNASSGTTALVNFFRTQYAENAKPGSRSVSIDDDEFWKYLQQAFGVEKTDEDDKAKETKDDLKNSAKDANTSGSPNSYNSVTISDEVKELLPSQGDFLPPENPDGYDGGDSFSGLFDSITNAIADLMEGIKQAALAGRDNLYVTQYIFDMFTYNTMEVESKVSNGVDSGEMSKSLAELGIKLETPSGIEKSSANNYMYGAEIEYILYGGFDADANIRSAKTTIFCIRFLANSGYALTNSEIRSITLPPALAVQAATMGVVPYKLTQVVLQLCLALGESVYDIKLMEQGQKVALIKTSDTWTMSPRGAMNAAKGFIKDELSDAVQTAAGKAKGVISDLINAGSEKVKVKADDYIEDMRIAVNEQVSQLVGEVFSSFEDEVVASLDSYLKKAKVQFRIPVQLLKALLMPLIKKLKLSSITQVIL